MPGNPHRKPILRRNLKRTVIQGMLTITSLFSVAKTSKLAQRDEPQESGLRPLSCRGLQRIENKTPKRNQGSIEKETNWPGRNQPAAKGSLAAEPRKRGKQGRGGEVTASRTVNITYPARDSNTQGRSFSEKPEKSMKSGSNSGSTRGSEVAQTISARAEVLSRAGGRLTHEKSRLAGEI